MTLLPGPREDSLRAIVMIVFKVRDLNLNPGGFEFF